MRAAFLVLLAAQAVAETDLGRPGGVAPTLALIGVALTIRAIRRAPEAADLPVSPIALAGVLAAAALVRFAHLDRFPGYLDGDAASYAAESLRVLDERRPLFATGIWGLTNVYFHALAIPQLVAERSFFAVRVFGAIGGVAAVLATAALARRAFGAWLGLLAAIVLGVLPMHLSYSRNGMEFVHASAVAPLAVLLVAAGWRRGSNGLLALAGAVLGAGLYATPAARLVAFVVLAELAFLHAGEPREHRSVRRLALAGAAVLTGVLLAVSPMVPHYLAHPENFDARVRDVSLLTSDWLGKEVAMRGAVTVWTTQILDSLAAFHARPSILPGPQWFRQPFLFPHDAALFTIGLLVALARARRSALAATLLAWLALGILFGGVLTVTTPKPTRYVILLPAVAITIALGLRALLPRRRIAAGVVLGAYAAAGLGTALAHDGWTLWMQDRTGRIASAAGLRLAASNAHDADVFFLATPWIHFGAGPALHYLSGIHGIDVSEPLDCAVLAGRRRRERTIVLAPAERAAELRPLRHALAAAGHESRLDAEVDPWGDLLVAVLELRAPVGDAAASCGGLSPASAPDGSEAASLLRRDPRTRPPPSCRSEAPPSTGRRVRRERAPPDPRRARRARA